MNQANPIKLSILICTLESRREMFGVLIQDILTKASAIDWNCDEDFEILYQEDNGAMPTGQKRNQILKMATGEYVAFLDDDDAITDDYFPIAEEVHMLNRDCASLRGILTHDGSNPEIFEHSIRYKEWKTVENAMTHEVKYERMPNHLNFIKREIAQSIPFPEITVGEDHRWSNKLHDSGMIKTEHYHDKPIYLYKHKSNKS